MQERLDAKLKKSVSAFTYYDEYRVPGAETLVIAYGVTARAAKTAVKKMQHGNAKASLLILKTLWPVPEALILEKAAPYKRVVMAEMNLGQYVRELERLLMGKKIDFLGQMNGELIKPGQIQEVIQNG
jgi:2-oxoglutarate ferredoxin oxidoreductase subunit alpha